MAERDPKTGRFVKGTEAWKQRKNPGRKTKVAEVAYLEILKEQVGEEEWAEMVAQVKKIAHGKGDTYWEKLKPADILRAFATLADRFLGKPTQPIQIGALPEEIERLDDGE